MKMLEASREVRVEKTASRTVAREVMSGLAVEQSKERLQHFLESKKVESLHLGNQQTEHCVKPKGATSQIILSAQF